MLCPVGSLESFHPGGAEPVVKAAAEFGIAHMLSSVCDPGLEEVAKAAPDGLRMFQLYVRGDAAWVDDYVERAIANKYGVFCLTVDTAHYSRRERDIAKRHITGGRRRASGREFQAALDWRTVERIKSKFKIPLAIKGIATAEDAKIALDHGVEFVYVSNHGGRQLDHGRGSMDVLPEVVEAVAGRAKIVIDGGFYRGSDVVKAIALGADLVGLGRMQPLRACGGGAGWHRAHARTDGGRNHPFDGIARRDESRQARSLLSARGDTRQSGARLLGIPASGDRAVPVLNCHSGAEPTGPARSGRPDDTLREEPGIHNHDRGSSCTCCGYGFRARRFRGAPE